MSRLLAFVPLAFLLQPSLISLNIPQPFLFPSNMSFIPSITQSVFTLLFLIFQAPSPITSVNVVLCHVTWMILALIIHLSGSAVGVHSSSFMCSLNGSMTMLLPSNCSIGPQGSYRGLVFTHTGGKRSFRFTQIVQRILEIKCHSMIRDLSKPGK